MGLILTLILGGLAGYIASRLLNRDEGMGIFLNIVVGIVGAFLANLLLAPVFGVTATLAEISLSGFIMSTIGAIVLLAIINLITRKRLR